MIEKTSSIEPRAGFEWGKVTWTSASEEATVCAYCGHDLRWREERNGQPVIVGTIAPLTLYRWDAQF
jgi:hypothetical protein